MAGASGSRSCRVLASGCENLLICGEPTAGDQHTSHLFSHAGLQHSFQWQSLPEDFLGAGSTFAAALTAFIAHGVEIRPAIRQAQEYTWKALANASRLGKGRLVPNRLPAQQS